MIKKIIMMIMLLLTLNTISATTDDAIAYWSLDNEDLTGSNPNDISGNNNHATNYGATTGVTGHFEEGFSFDGTDDYIEKSEYSPNNMQTGTVNFWLQVDSYKNYFGIFELKNQADNNEINFRFFGTSSGIQVYPNRGGSSTNEVYTISENTLGNGWNFFSLTIDSSKNAKLYLNGNLINSFSNSVVFDTFSATDLNLGVNLLSSGRYLDGKIDEVSIYDRALSSTEVGELYALTSNPYTSSAPVLNPEITFDLITLNNVENFNNTYINQSNNNFYVKVSQNNSNDNINIYANLWNGTTLQIAENSLDSDDFIYETQIFENPYITINNTNYSIYGSSTVQSNIDQYCIEQDFDGGNNYISDVAGYIFVYYSGVQWQVINTSPSLRVGLSSITCYNKRDFILENLDDNIYNISFYAENNEINVTSNNYTFTIDTTAPEINIIGNMTQAFEVDFSTIFNVTDTISGVDTCTIEITYLENVTNPAQYNDLINCGDIKTFTANGLYVGLVTAIDIAGNTQTLSLNGTISTNVALNFYDSNNDSISGYDITILHPSGEIEEYNNYNNPILIYPYYNYEIDLGVYNITFEKLGYLTTSFELNITETSGGETINYNLQNSKIVLSIYDKSTNDLITTSTEIVLINSNYTETITTGQTEISQLNFYDGEYQIILTNEDYQTESLYFNYNNKEELIVNAYMLPTNLTNLGVINVKVEDSINIIQNQLVNLQAWDSSQSAYITIGQAKTNSNGDAFFNVELGTTMYKVVSVRDNIILESPEQIISLSGTIIYLIFSNNLEPVVNYGGQGISGKITNSYFNATHDTIKFVFFDKDNLVSEVCLEVNRLKGSYSTPLGEPLCTNTPSGTLEIITSNNNSYVKELLGVAYIDNVKVKIDNFIYSSNLDLETSLGDLSKWIILAILIGTIALGVVLGNVNIIGISTIIMSWIVYSIFSTSLSYTIPLLITIIMVLLLYGTFKKRF